MSFQDSFWGPNGFEELRKSIKEGQDFTKDIAAILHERCFSSSLEDDVVKPIKVLLDCQHKQRKILENTVDKVYKSLNDRRNEELKAKKISYACARENERMQEQALDCKLNKGKLLTEKDIHKVSICLSHGSSLFWNNFFYLPNITFHFNLKIIIILAGFTIFLMNEGNSSFLYKVNDLIIFHFSN
ncbi:unnamed protein product [Larinioides sclopetarius]|uniref:Uncharacterized protein n=1 Tax=Larinioides sclopetarius TaxID=280406 RepID=A0AAV2AWL9_9ARAC